MIGRRYVSMEKMKKNKGKTETSGSTAGPLQKKKVSPKSLETLYITSKVFLFLLIPYLNLRSTFVDSLSFHKLLSLTSVVIFCFAFAFSFATCIQSKCPVFCLSQSMPSRFLQEDY